MNPEETPVEPETEAGQPASDAQATPASSLATLQGVRRKKRKRKYSRGLRDVQELGRTVSKASTRVARAVAKGMAQYRKRSEKSARKKRDGAILDFAVNMADGLGKTIRGLSVLPADLAKGLTTKRGKRRARRQLRFTSRVLRPLG